MPSSCTNASSMTTSAAVRLSPLSCLKSHPPCRFFCNDEVVCQSRRSRFHCRYVYASVGAEKLGGGSCPNRGPTGILINYFLLSCHGFVPRRAPQSTVDLPSQKLVQNRQYRDTVTCLPAHTEQISAKVGDIRIICTRSGSIVILLPPTHQQGSTNNQGHQMNQKCTIMTKLVLCSEPHACAPTAVQQMMIVR